MKKRRYGRKRPAWIEGIWVRNLFAAIAVAAASIVIALYLAGIFPELAARIDRALTGKSDVDQKTAIAGSGIQPLTEIDSASQSDTRAIQGHLLASVSGNKITIVNEGTIPIRITRLVRNKRYGVPWCDTDEDVNSDPNKSADFSNRADQVLMLGDSYSGVWSSTCGGAGIVEVQTDRGIVTFKLSR